MLDSGKEAERCSFNLTSWTRAIASAYKADVRAWMYCYGFWFQDIVGLWCGGVLTVSLSPLFSITLQTLHILKSAKCLLSKLILIFSNMKREENLPVLMQAMVSKDRKKFTYRKERQKRQERRTHELNHDARHQKQYLGFSEGNCIGSHLLWLHCGHGDQIWDLL